ncbi:hypothetical protein B0A48_12547 [Cryoendolithus antarcticus]|uniref:Uncharacterized protein n=1 Tax=Cryoendolithus antarcticus TaxID=1507870 RepID=A0A1V8SQS4_9PEZI|nr:hypothetical protein B0A48_12547 [Cryoendolithus antarcticus]
MAAQDRQTEALEEKLAAHIRERKAASGVVSLEREALFERSDELSRGTDDLPSRIDTLEQSTLAHGTAAYERALRICDSIKRVVESTNKAADFVAACDVASPSAEILQELREKALASKEGPDAHLVSLKAPIAAAREKQISAAKAFAHNVKAWQVVRATKVEEMPDESQQVDFEHSKPLHATRMARQLKMPDELGQAVLDFNALVPGVLKLGVKQESSGERELEETGLVNDVKRPRTDYSP